MQVDVVVLDRTVGPLLELHVRVEEHHVLAFQLVGNGVALLGLLLRAFEVGQVRLEGSRRLGLGRRALEERIAVGRHREARLTRYRQRVEPERHVIRVAAMLEGLGGRSEVPGIDQLEVRRHRLRERGELELRGAGVALADERLRRHLRVLDQQVEARADRGGTAAAVDPKAISRVAVGGHPVADTTPLAFPAPGTGQLVLIIVRVQQHGLADTREVGAAGQPKGQLADP